MAATAMRLTLRVLITPPVDMGNGAAAAASECTSRAHPRDDGSYKKERLFARRRDSADGDARSRHRLKKGRSAPAPRPSFSWLPSGG